jgi:TrmH family RNA methyltransferase
MPRVRIVLVEPERPANVGAVARVVRNTGLEGLDLVSPGDWRTVECWRTAWGAHDVLEQARVYATLSEALAEVELAVGLSGRSDAGIAPLDVRDAAERVAGLPPVARAALVLGSESRGLDRDGLAAVGIRARIPTHPDQPSLNLSHAAAVAACEVHRALRSGTASGPRVAAHGEVERVLELLRPGLLGVGALPARSEESHFREWRSMLHRAALTPRHLKLIEHLARRLALRIGPGAS